MSADATATTRTRRTSAGVWATWFDLSVEHRETFSAWLTEAYLPGLAKVAEFAWVAHYVRHEGGGLVSPWTYPHEPHPPHTAAPVGAGSNFVILVGAASPHAFFDPLITEQEEAVCPGAKEMLVLRRGARQEIFLEEARALGPDGPAAEPGDAPAPVIQFGSFRMAGDDDFTCGRWYATVCLPVMATARGSIRTRKWAGLAGWSKHGVLYEFGSIEGRNQAFGATQERRRADPDKVWPIGPLTVHAPGSAFIGHRTWHSASK